MPGFEFFGAEERKEVNDVLETGILMRYGFDGPRKGIWKAKELETAITQTFGCKYAQLTSSGTAALTTAMVALGIGAGDEIIMPSFTFVASFEAVLSVGAIPVLVGVLFNSIYDLNFNTIGIVFGILGMLVSSLYIVVSVIINFIFKKSSL